MYRLTVKQLEKGVIKKTQIDYFGELNDKEILQQIELHKINPYTVKNIEYKQVVRYAMYDKINAQSFAVKFEDGVFKIQQDINCEYTTEVSSITW